MTHDEERALAVTEMERTDLRREVTELRSQLTAEQEARKRAEEELTKANEELQVTRVDFEEWDKSYRESQEAINDARAELADAKRALKETLALEKEARAEVERLKTAMGDTFVVTLAEKCADESEIERLKVENDKLASEQHEWHAIAAKRKDEAKQEVERLKSELEDANQTIEQQQADETAHHHYSTRLRERLAEAERLIEEARSMGGKWEQRRRAFLVPSPASETAQEAQRDVFGIHGAAPQWVQPVDVKLQPWPKPPSETARRSFERLVEEVGDLPSGQLATDGLRPTERTEFDFCKIVDGEMVACDGYGNEPGWREKQRPSETAREEKWDPTNGAPVCESCKKPMTFIGKGLYECRCQPAPALPLDEMRELEQLREWCRGLQETLDGMGGSMVQIESRVAMVEDYDRSVTVLEARVTKLAEDNAALEAQVKHLTAQGEEHHERLMQTRETAPQRKAGERHSFWQWPEVASNYCGAEADGVRCAMPSTDPIHAKPAPTPAETCDSCIGPGNLCETHEAEENDEATVSLPLGHAYVPGAVPACCHFSLGRREFCNKVSADHVPQPAKEERPFDYERVCEDCVVWHAKHQRQAGCDCKCHSTTSDTKETGKLGHEFEQTPGAPTLCGHIYNDESYCEASRSDHEAGCERPDADRVHTGFVIASTTSGTGGTK